MRVGMGTVIHLLFCQPFGRLCARVNQGDSAFRQGSDSVREERIMRTAENQRICAEIEDRRQVFHQNRPNHNIIRRPAAVFD